jgi:predicted  nucleic acid-binding Zn-ribbon protein
MTTTRYFVARIAQAFGYVRRAQRMGDAASEMHLLREAEAHLGKVVWEKVEHIEPLSVEYWNLRKLGRDLDEVRERLAAAQRKLDLAHEERANVLNNMPEANQELLDRRMSLLTELESLAQKRDGVVAAAREVRRAYVGLKMKLEVLITEAGDQPPDEAQVTVVKQRLQELKTRFAELKQQRIEVGLKIEDGDSKVDEVDELLKLEKSQRRLLASEAFEAIGEGNKEISVLRAESGLLETRMRQLYAEIGRYVSRHSHQDPACAAAVASHRGLVDVMRALRRSVALNHRLAGNA